MYYDKNKITPHEKKAEELFLSGYNCAQAVFAAFSDVTGVSGADSARMASAFGGGMCAMRKTCGSVSGMLMVLGCMRGYSEAGDHDGKKRLYADGKALAAEFETLLGSTECAELLKGIKLSDTPSIRTAEYYAVRPCAKFCAVAANILDNYLDETRENDAET